MKKAAKVTKGSCRSRCSSDSVLPDSCPDTVSVQTDSVPVQTESPNMTFSRTDEVEEKAAPSSKGKAEPGKHGRERGGGGGVREIV